MRRKIEARTLNVFTQKREAIIRILIEAERGLEVRDCLSKFLTSIERWEDYEISSHSRV